MTVKQYQQVLASQGLYGGAIDGIRGPKTIAAVKAYQSAHGLAVDGIVGPKTIAALGGGGGGSGSSAPAAPSGPSINDTELAQQYGFAMAVLNSDPELSGLFHRAVAETWTADRFQAQLRGTQWYQQHNEQWRNAAILKSSDPQSYNANVDQTQVRIGMMASQMGAAMGDLHAFAEQAYQLGWDDNQIRQSLSTYVQYTDGRMLGQAGQWDTELRDFAYNNGLNLSDEWYRGQVQNTSAGKQTIDDGKSQITNMAVSAFPHLAEQLRAGQTVADIADPYRQSMASLLELNPKSIGLDDPSIKQALSVKGADGNVSMKTLWQFENDTRSDPRWMKTQNAQNQAMSVTKRVLGDMGLV